MANINEIENLTIGEILQYSLEERKNSRFNAMGKDKDGNAIDISKVDIDGVIFTDYKAFSFVWEDSYVKSPERSGSGTIENLNSYAWFLTPHLKIDFSLLSIDSYRKLIVDLKHKKREFTVTCYDPTYNEMTTNKMYFPPEEMPKLLTIARALNGEQWVELLGVQDYTVEMIGTNSSLDKVEVLYYDEFGSLISEATQSVVKGTEAIINYYYKPKYTDKFTGTWLTGDDYDVPINVGEAIRITKDLKLRPKMRSATDYTLSFDYGKGIVPIRRIGGTPVTSVEVIGAVLDYDSNIVTHGEAISTAIARANIDTTKGTFTFPSTGTGLNAVEYEFDKEVKKVAGSKVYDFKGWYWASEENDSLKVEADSLFDYNVNRTIYQIYKAIPHTLTYDTGTTEIMLSPQYLGYGENVILPNLAREGYIFKGWFLESGNSAPTIMPPEDMKVKAIWEEIE